MTIYDVTYMWNLKYDANELVYKLDTSSRTGEGGVRAWDQQIQTSMYR